MALTCHRAEFRTARSGRPARSTTDRSSPSPLAQPKILPEVSMHPPHSTPDLTAPPVQIRKPTPPTLDQLPSTYPRILPEVMMHPPHSTPDLTTPPVQIRKPTPPTLDQFPRSCSRLCIHLATLRT
eukprot:3403524-Rhodomonas_salina.2